MPKRKLAGTTPRPLAMALEPRLMFDAAAIVTAVQNAQPDAPPPEAHQTEAADGGQPAGAGAAADTDAHAAQLAAALAGIDQPSDSPVADPAADLTAPADLAAPAETAPTETAPTETTGAARREVVVVDWTVSDWQTLVAGIDPGTPVIFLEQGQSGVTGLADALAGYENLDAVHLVTHGANGAILLGGEALAYDTLDSHGDDLARIGATLKSGGDLLLYGCTVAGNAAGEQFVDDLAAALGNDVDVAASDDRTGPTRLQGDWDLEYSTGQIDTVLPFTLSGMQDIGHCLGCTVNSGLPASAGAGGVFVGQAIVNENSPTVAVGVYRLYGGQEYYHELAGNAWLTLASFEANNSALCDGGDTTDPTISDIANQSISQGGNTGSLSFTVGDDTTAVGSLTVTGSSSNTSLIPNGNIVFGGSAGSRTVTVTPASGQSGISTITVTVEDAAGNQATDTFTVTVTAPDTTDPTISSIGNQTINEDGDTGALAFTIDDNVTAPGSLTVTGSSSNTSLIPDANIVFGGSAGSRTVTVTPAANASGSATITITVKDAALNDQTRTFTVTVSPVNDDPAAPTDSNGSANSATEGAANGSTVGVTASATDVDGDTPTYTLTDTAGGRFAIDGSTGVVTVADGSLLNHETATSHSITVQAADGNGGTSSQSFTIAVANAAPATPTDGNGSANSVTEGSANGTTVGITASASDPSGGTVTYSLTDDAGGRFAIDGTTGVVTVANGTLLVYANATSHDITVQASDGLLTSTQTFAVGVTQAGPTVTDGAISIAGASGTGGAFKVGDTVTATWNDTGAGDDNGDISAVTVDFSQFGGGSAVAATNASGIWTATYIIAAGSIDATNRNVSVTATSGSGSTTRADTSNATVDSQAPTVTDARISISGASGTDGAYKIGDTVTATWNNTAGGDNNADTFSAVTVDLSQFGGGSAVAATESSGTWTASYTIVAGVIDTTNRNVSVTATDDAGNTTTTADTTNATVDSAAPTVADANISISGSSGTDGAYKVGDTVTATWNNAVAGDNNTDTISAVTVDFSGFGGGAAVAATSAAGVWTATYTIAAGAIEATNRNVSVTATDNAGNATTTADTTNATVDNQAPAAPSVTAISQDTGTSSSDGITSDQTLTISGTAEANSTITVLLGGGSIGTTTSDGAGAWSFVHATTLTAGPYAITATATDGAGNTGAASSAFALTVDTTAPAAPAVTGISQDTGSSGSDGVTSDQTLTITGTAEANSTVTVLLDGGSIGTATANGSGAWSFVHATTLTAGPYAITATATDAAGNTSVASDAFAVTVDLSAPAAPAVTGISDDTGSSGSDGITTDQTLTITGTAEANSTVTVLLDGGSIGTATANGSGAWSFDHTGTALAVGSYNLTATATDAAGNTSAASSAFAVTISAAPAAPSVTAISQDTGTSGTDGITSDQTLTISGTAEANRTITVHLGGSSIGTTTSDGTGAWSFVHATTLTAGPYAITATATDGAGNTGAASSAFALTVDTTAPAAPAVTGISQDTGSSGSDGVTSDQTLTITGTAEANSTVTVLLDGGSIGTTTANGSGAWSFDHTATTLTAGPYAITATATDAAGNTGVASDAFAVTVDLSAPAAPAVTGISDDTGSSGSDGITSDQTLTITGTAEANSTVTVLLDGGSIGTATANGSGTWSFDHTATTLTAGPYAITATATDAAGNTSVASDAFAVTVDLSAPAAPAVTGISDDTGSSSSDGITTDQTLTITGTAEANSTVTVLLDGGSIGTTTSDGTGAWSFVHATTLTAGPYAITATASDAAGNTSVASSAFAVTVDLSAPAAPAVTGISQDTGSSGSDGITSDQTLTITGTAEANSTVTVLLDGGSIGTTTANGSGAWSFDHTATTLTAGPYAITATATDAAGNTGVASDAFAVTVDLSAPAAPAVTGISDDTGSSSSDGITTDQTLTITGTAEANSTVTVLLDGGSIGTTTANGSGAWSFDHTGAALAVGSYNLTATATDAAGNTSTASSAFAVTISAAPAAPSVTAISQDTGTSGTDGITSDQTLTISGTAEANRTITVLIGGSSIGTTTSDGTGAWSFVHATTLTAGPYAITATATDGAGNTGAASSAFTLTVDTTAPAAPAVTGISQDTGSSGSDGVTSDQTLTITGTAEANSTVTVLLDGGSIGTATANGSGAWSFVHATTLTAGPYAITATASDAAGNTSVASSAFAVTVDPSAPAAPVVTDLATVSDTGSSSTDDVTSDTTPTFTGTAEADSAVSLYDTDGTTVIGTGTADGTGVWSITASTLADGIHTVTAKATDAAGNVSPASTGLAVTIDTTAPTVPTGIDLDPASDSGAVGDLVTNDSTPTFTGTAEADSTVTLYDTDGITAIGTGTADGLGAWSITASALMVGIHDVTAKATDAAGNVSGASGILTFTVEAIPGPPEPPPPPPVVAPPTVPTTPTEPTPTEPTEPTPTEPTEPTPTEPTEPTPTEPTEPTPTEPTPTEPSPAPPPPTPPAPTTTTNTVTTVTVVNVAPIEVAPTLPPVGGNITSQTTGSAVVSGGSGGSGSTEGGGLTGTQMTSDPSSGSNAFSIVRTSLSGGDGLSARYGAERTVTGTGSSGGSAFGSSIGSGSGGGLNPGITSGSGSFGSGGGSGGGFGSGSSSGSGFGAGSSTGPGSGSGSGIGGGSGFSTPGGPASSGLSPGSTGSGGPDTGGPDTGGPDTGGTGTGGTGIGGPETGGESDGPTLDEGTAPAGPGAGQGAAPEPSANRPVEQSPAPPAADTATILRSETSAYLAFLLDPTMYASGAFPLPEDGFDRFATIGDDLPHAGRSDFSAQLAGVGAAARQASEQLAMALAT